MIRTIHVHLNDATHLSAQSDSEIMMAKINKNLSFEIEVECDDIRDGGVCTNGNHKGALNLKSQDNNVSVNFYSENGAHLSGTLPLEELKQTLTCTDTVSLEISCDDIHRSGYCPRGNHKATVIL